MYDLVGHQEMRLPLVQTGVITDEHGVQTSVKTWTPKIPSLVIDTLSKLFKGLKMRTLSIISIILLSVVMGGNMEVKSEYVTDTQIIKTHYKSEFSKWLNKSEWKFECFTIVKIKGKYYIGEGNSNNRSMSKSKSYMDCLFNYTYNKPLSKLETFYYINVVR